MKAVTLILLVIYAVLWELVYGIARFLALFLPRLRRRIGNRPATWNQALQLMGPENRHVMIYCSSAGEYEQARPVADQITRSAKQTLYAFFSTSGSQFATVRGEKAPWFLVPPDNPWRWSRILADAGIERSIVVRHELWPGFLWAASRRGEVYLINGVLPAGHVSRIWPKLKLPLLSMISRICVVDNESADWYRQKLGISPDRVIVTGDTKYDQVLNRMDAKASAVATMRAKLVNMGVDGRILVVGSAWVADVEQIAEALSKQESFSEDDWRVVIVPHDIGPDNITAIRRVFDRFRISSALWSKPERAEFRVLIVDAMGLLADLYGCGTAALVGGGFHNKVHNVLEPACYGLPVACGPLYKNSAEARLLVKAGHCVVTHHSGEVGAFLKKCETLSDKDCEEVRSFVRSLGGATGRVVTALNLAEVRSP